MEHGFFHHERGYWQTNSDVPQWVLDTYPEGTVEVPVKPGPEYEWDGSEWAHVPPDPAEALAAERAHMVCSRFQAKRALFDAGLLSAVEDAVKGADVPTQLAWDEATEFRRNSPTIAAIAGALKLTDEQIDDLFRAAMQIEA